MGHAEKLQQELNEIHYNERVKPVRAWLYDTIDGIVDSAAGIYIEATVDAMELGVVTFHVRVARADIGKVIGKQGRTARSLRTLLGCRGMKDKIRYALDIVETEQDINADLKTKPCVSSDCQYGDHASCDGEESALWPDGDQTIRKCSCPCHAAGLISTPASFELTLRGIEAHTIIESEKK